MIRLSFIIILLFCTINTKGQKSIKDIDIIKKSIKSIEYNILQPSFFQPEAIIIDGSEVPKTSVADSVISIDSIESEAIISDYLESNLSIKRLIQGPSQYDSRVDIRELPEIYDWQKYIHKNASSIAVIIEKDKIHQIADTMFQLDIGISLGAKFSLCPDEAFTNQPVVGSGTCFVIDRNKVMTASHVFSQSIQNYVIVFGFEMVNKYGAYEAIIGSTDIYYPISVNYNDADLDITIVTTDRDIAQVPLTVGNSLELRNQSLVYMIGHPLGLPKKLAMNARIVENSTRQYFYTSLDAFQGNSGSPVFSFETNEVIGILVSGEIDYQWNGSCYESNLCKIPQCAGEK